MKQAGILISLIIAIILAACTANKKSTSTKEADTTIHSPAPAKSDGIYAPGEKELNALRANYKDLTLETLTKGYNIYSNGACINCHGAKNIYEISIMQWDNILEDMAPRAALTEAEKDAVYKYVLSIKSTEPK